MRSDQQRARRKLLGLLDLGDLRRLCEARSVMQMDRSQLINYHELRWSESLRAELSKTALKLLRTAK